MKLTLLQKLCGLITDHKHSTMHSWSVEIEPTEYYHKCKICGYQFWNYSKENDIKWARKQKPLEY